MLRMFRNSTIKNVYSYLEAVFSFDRMSQSLRKHQVFGQKILKNERGIGLITSIFVIVIVGMFGTLIARYATLSSVSSAESYLWAQALYSAQSAAQITVLYDDGGGMGSESLTTVSGFTTNTLPIVSGVRAEAERSVNGTMIHREIEVRVSL